MFVAFSEYLNFKGWKKCPLHSCDWNLELSIFCTKNISASMFINKVHTALIIYNFGSHAFYFLVVAKWFSSIVVVHITAMFNVHIRIGHRWNKGQRVLLPQNSVFVLQSRVCEKMSFEESKRVVYICRHPPYNLMLYLGHSAYR